MKTRMITNIAVAASILASVSVAEAGGKHKGGKGFKGKHFHGHIWHEYDHYRPYGGGCRYYLKKAKFTGSPYWFNKYRLCIGAY